MKKHLLTYLLTCTMLFSCTENVENDILNEKVKQVQQEKDLVYYQKSFAKILSKLVSSEESVRSFIKEEALLQFDRDYDVFYPYVKNKMIKGEMTFRDFLLLHCSESELSLIEEKLPLLNILVPDLSLFCDFTPSNWDITQKDIAVISRDDNENILYINGDDSFQLPMGQIPGFPCLVVKNNERITISASQTRASSELEYEFVDDIFNGEKYNKLQTRGSSSYYKELENNISDDLYIKSSELDSHTISAYKIYKNIPNGYDRDYIYYGITNKTDIGEINRNIRETLYRFRINPRMYKIIADQEGVDPSLQFILQPSKELNSVDILKRIWTDGMFEFVFTVMVSDQNSSESMKHTLIIPLRASELFSIKKVNVLKYQSIRPLYIYRVELDDLESKWVYPSRLGLLSHIFLQPWDLYTKSLVIHVSVEEKDDGQSIERTETYQNEYANKADFESSGIIGKISSKIGYGFSSKESKTTTTKVTTTVGSDYLGTLTFYYYDPIITEEVKFGYYSGIINNMATNPEAPFTSGRAMEPWDPNITYKYSLYSVNNGAIEMTILPKTIR